jgi:PncC family amidohydrolase
VIERHRIHAEGGGAPEETGHTDHTPSTRDLVAAIAQRCAETGAHVAAVESLTSGAVASALGAGEGASDWFRGAVVAYEMQIKHELLHVSRGTDPCSPLCASTLAASGRSLLSADACVSTTGVGGPEPEDGHEPGEVHIGVATAAGTVTRSHRFSGSPEDVVEAAVHAALRALWELGDVRPSLGDPATDDVRIERMKPADAGEILTVQRAAFVSEAQLYGSADTPPLTQTLDQLDAELVDADGWVARRDGRLVGVIRTREDDGVLLIGRIAIAPDQQGHGIGRRLLETAESASHATVAELFTGSLSEGNLRLYRECGYRESERIDQGDGTAQVFLRKDLRH